MMEKVWSKAQSCMGHVFNKKAAKGFAQEFLPAAKYLEIKLDEICTQCPLHNREEEPSCEDSRPLSPSDWERLDGCRRHFFGILLQSFVGKPGDDETKRLYAYLKRCDECLLSATGVRLRPLE